MPPSQLRRSRRWLLLLALLGVLGWGYCMEQERREANVRPAAPFPEVVRPETEAGWRVVQPPDLPGPYRRVRQKPFVVGKGEVGKLILRDKTHQFEKRDDVDQMAVPLETEDGRLTLVILER